MTQTVTIKIEDGQTFGRTLKFVKEHPESRYNPTDKTWTIPVRHRILGDGIDRKQYRYKVVTPVGCPHYTKDQGCPLHGEYCQEAQ